MTPRQYKQFELELKKEAEDMVNDWLYPLSKNNKELHEVLGEMEPFALNQKDVPLRIKLVENPKYKTSRIFNGAVSLFNHDCIHVVLGRGLLVKDEAFVIGYTMGSTKNISRWRKNLFLFITKYLYPEGYKFGEEERFVFNMGVMAGGNCKQDLSKVDFSAYSAYTPCQIRDRVGIDEKLLLDCYSVEGNFFPDSPESQRLL